MEFEDLKVVELKSELRQRGLPVSGVKAVLIQRLRDYESKAKQSNGDHGAEPPGADGTPGRDEDAGGGDDSGGQRLGTDARDPGGDTAAAVPAGGGGSVGGVEATTPTTPAETPAPGIDAPLTGASQVGEDPVGTAPASSPSVHAREGDSVSGVLGGGAGDGRPGAGVTHADDEAQLDRNGGAVPGTRFTAPSEGNEPGRGTTAQESARGTSSSERAGFSRAAAASGPVVGGDIASAIVVSFSTVSVTLACIAGGEGLTAANLVCLHVSLTAVLVVGRAATRKLGGWRAMGVRALATAAMVYVVFDAIRQIHLQETLGDAHGVSPLAGEGGAAGGDRGSGETCSVLGGDAGGESGLGQCSTGQAGEAAITANFGSKWVGRKISEAIYGPDENLDGWVEGLLATEFTVVGFWGLASVLGYLALVEALPVVLKPLHGFIRMLERAHNVLLSLASLAMLAGISRACVVSGKAGSVHDLLCGRFDEEDGIFTLTSHAIFWSNAWRWFDTALLIAKGEAVSWCHYMHHASSMILTSWNMVPQVTAAWSMVCASDCFVYWWMYAYKAFPRYGFLRRSGAWIAGVQVIQHVCLLMSGIYVVYQAKVAGECYNNATAIYAGMGLCVARLSSSVLFRRVDGTKLETS